MSKGKNKPNKGGKGEPVALITGYTDSVQKIGADAALIGLIVVGGFAALGVGAEADGVILFAVVIWAAWTVTKYLDAYIGVRRDQTALDKTRIERGQKILESHPDRQRRLSLRKKGEDKDG